MPPSESVDASQPSGTVTLVFTDIEGSTSLLQALGDRYPEVLADHHRLIREAFGKHGALERGSAGDGLYFVFQAAGSAVQAAVDGQLAVAEWSWPDGAQVRDRMGLHTGEPVRGDRGLRRARRPSGGPDLRGRPRRPDPHLADDPRPRRRRAQTAPSALIDLGAHRLRSLEGPPQRLFQVTGPGLIDDFPPPRTSEAPRNNLQLEVTSFIGREREIEQATRDARAVVAADPDRPGRRRQDPDRAAPGEDAPGRVRGRRVGRRVRRADRSGARPAVGRQHDRPDRAGRPLAAADDRRPPQGQAPAPRPGRLRSRPRGQCASWPRRSSERARPSGSWSPAARRWACPARRSCRSPRWRRRPPASAVARPATSARSTPAACSSSGPAPSSRPST